MVISFSFSIIFVCTCMSKLVHLLTYVGTVPHAAFILFLPSVLIRDLVVICLSRLFLSRKRNAITYISRLLGCVFSYVVNYYDLHWIDSNERLDSSSWEQQLCIQHFITKLAPKLRGQTHRDMFATRMVSNSYWADLVLLSSVLFSF
jgi:hypothetical protein